jgi:hypothetical protein
MPKIAGLLLSASLAIPLAAQAPENACCEVTAKVDAGQAGGSPAMLRIVVKNVAADLVVVEWGSNDEIRLAVLGKDGRETERTELGKRLLTKALGGSMRSRGLGRDETFEQVVDLAEFFVLKPGDYSVIVIRKIVVAGSRVPFPTKAGFSIP